MCIKDTVLQKNTVFHNTPFKAIIYLLIFYIVESTILKSECLLKKKSSKTLLLLTFFYLTYKNEFSMQDDKKGSIGNFNYKN